MSLGEYQMKDENERITQDEQRTVFSSSSSFANHQTAGKRKEGSIRMIQVFI
jgi:hypothetical protein